MDDTVAEINYYTFEYNHDIPEYIINQIIYNEYRLQEQLYIEQNNLNEVPILSYEEWEAFRKNKKVTYIIGLTNDNKLAGSICFFVNRDYTKEYYPLHILHAIHISQFYVDPILRKNRIGSNLMNFTIQYALKHSVKTLELNTSYNNHTSKLFYKTFNYQIKSVRMSLDVIDTLVKSPIIRYDANDIISSKIDMKLHEKMKQNDNRYRFTHLKNNILEQLKNHIFGIFDFNDNINYLVWTIWKEPKSLRILDFLIDDYKPINLNHLIRSCMAFCNNNKIDKISTVVRYKDYYVYSKVGFYGKMLYLRKELY